MEESLRCILNQMTIGVGALPAIEPWRAYARKLRALGIDISPVTEPFWDVFYGGKYVKCESELLTRAILLRCVGIMVLMIGLRVLLLKTTHWDDEVFSTFDLPTMIACVVMAGWLTRAALSALPRSWIWAEKSEDFSADFYKWSALLMMGNTLEPLTCPELEVVRLEHSLLRRAELRDGNCRESLRRRFTIEAGRTLNLQDREKLRRFSGVLPLLDLLLAGILCIGFCGIPFLEWLMQSGVS